MSVAHRGQAERTAHKKALRYPQLSRSKESKEAGDGK